MIAHCRRGHYWHSDTLTLMVTVDKCPSCDKNHPSVVLYVRDDHDELPPQDFLNSVLLPCGTTVDMIYEYDVTQV